MERRQDDPDRVFSSQALENDHPHVDSHLLKEIYKINKRFILEWELQVSGYHRWHFKLHRTEGMEDHPAHVFLLCSPEGDIWGDYVPVDGRAVNRLRQIMIWSADPVRFALDLMAEEQAAKDYDDAERDQLIEDWANHYRRLFARLADSTPDCRWSPGISRNLDGSYSTSQGAQNRRMTSAI